MKEVRRPPRIVGVAVSENAGDGAPDRVVPKCRSSARECNAVLVVGRDASVEPVVRAHLGRDFDWFCVDGRGAALRRIAHVRLVLIDVEGLHPRNGAGLLPWLSQWPEAVFVLLADRRETVRFHQFGKVAALVLLKPLSEKSLEAVARAALR